jgi:hypothetical protein
MAINGRWCPLVPRLRLPPRMVAHAARPSPRHRLAWRRISFHRDLLRVDGSPSPFALAGGTGPAPTIQAALHPRGGQTCRAVETGARCPVSRLATLWASPRQGLVQRFQAQAHGPRERDRPREDRPTAPRHHRDQGKPPTLEPQRGTLRPPDWVHLRARASAASGRGHARGRRGLTPPGLRRPGLPSHGPPPPRHPCLMPRGSVTPSPGGQTTPAIRRRVGVWLSQDAPQSAMGCPGARRLVGGRGPWPPDQGPRPRPTHLRRRRCTQRPRGLRGAAPRFCSPSPTRLGVAPWVGPTARGLPHGRARVWRGGPSTSRGSPGGGAGAHGPSGSEAPRTCWLRR